MSHKVELLISVTVISLLKYSYIVNSAFVQILVFIGIQRIDLNPDHAEILSRQLAGFADVLHTALCAALACENKYLLHTAVGDDLHLVLDLLHIKLHALYVIIAVKSAVNAVVLAVVGDIQRSEQIYGIAEMLLGLKLRTLSHLLKERLRRRRKQCLEILNSAGLMVESCIDVTGSILRIIIVLHLSHNFVHNVGLYTLHAFHVLHVICA